MNQETVVIPGYAPPGREKYYQDVPFELPPGVARLDVHYEYSEQIDSDPYLTGGNTVDIGLFDWRGDAFLHTGFRGWTGSERHDLYITPTEATPGYMPGPLTPGTWHISLGFYKVGPNGCHYTVTVTFTFGAATATDFPPMLTLASPNAQLKPSADGWYKGELHCHTIHSDGDSTAAEVIAAAVALGLDFLAITDHNNVTHLMELAGLGVQPLILIPGYEVTTYHGHWNVWGPETWVDFRIESPADMQAALDFAYAHVNLTSCNHPRPFGPPWEYADVHSRECIEVWNGPWAAANDIALEFWETCLRAGQRLVAVGGSDMHHLKTNSDARLALPTTWIYCPGAPTAAGLLAGLRAGHAFLSDGVAGPKVYFSVGEALAGDTIARPASEQLDVSLRIVDGAGLELQIIGADGLLLNEVVTYNDQPFIFTVPVAGTPYVRVQVVQPEADGFTVRALSNPIFFA